MRMADDRDAAMILQLGALGHPARFKAARLLLAAGQGGIQAGALAEAVGLKPNALTPHLSRLVEAGLVRRDRAGRVIVYRADSAAVTDLLGFLLEDCCGGRPDLCSPAAWYMEGKSS